MSFGELFIIQLLLNAIAIFLWATGAKSDDDRIYWSGWVFWALGLIPMCMIWAK